jgi:hypothetical protein
LKHSKYFSPLGNLILFFPRKFLIEELGRGYHLNPCSSKNVRFSLGKLLLSELGWSYHLVHFSPRKLLPKAITLKKFPKGNSFFHPFCMWKKWKIWEKN